MHTTRLNRRHLLGASAAWLAGCATPAQQAPLLPLRSVDYLPADWQAAQRLLAAAQDDGTAWRSSAVRSVGVSATGSLVDSVIEIVNSTSSTGVTIAVGGDVTDSAIRIAGGAQATGMTTTVTGALRRSNFSYDGSSGLGTPWGKVPSGSW